AERLAAARELAASRVADKQTVQTLLDLITPRLPPELAAGILQALQVNEVPEAGALILDRLGTMTPSIRVAGFALVLSRPEWTKELLARADRGELQLSELSLDQKQALAEHPDRAVRRQARELLKRGGALPNADRQKVLDE